MIQVLYCSEPKMLKRVLKKLVLSILPSKDDMNYVELDMAESKLIDLYNEAESLPLGYDKKVVVADNFFYLTKSKGKTKLQKNDDDEPLLEYFSSPNPYINLFLVVYADSLDEKSKFFKALKQGEAKFSQVGLLSEDEWKKYATSYFEKRGSSLDNDARDLLLSRTKGDYSLFLNESDKLLAYASKERVTKEIVETLSVSPLEEDVFQLSRALSKGDKGSALAIYKDLKIKNTSAVTLLNLLAKEYRFLNEVAILQKQGADAFTIARELIASPGRVNACLFTLRKLSTRKIGECQEMIYQSLLSIMQGKMGEELAFSLLINNFPIEK